MNRLPLDPRQSALAVRCGIRFFLSAALTGCELLSGAPLALGFLAAAGTGAPGLSALAGAVVGAFLFLDFSSALSYIATAVLILSTATAFEGTALVKRPLFLPAAASVLFLTVRLIYLFQSPRLDTQFFPALGATILVGLSAAVYRLLLREGETPGSQWAVLFLIASLTVGLSGLVLPGGISVGRLLAAGLTLYAAYGQSPGLGAGCGVCIGLLLDLAAGSGGLFFAAAFGFTGLAAGLYARRGRLRAAGAYLAAAVILLLPVTAEEGVPFLGEAIGGAVVFLLLPARLFGGKRLQLREGTPKDEPSLLDRLRTQLNQSAAAFRDLYDSFSRLPSTEENPAVIFDRSAERVCRSCVLRDLCWKREYTTTFNAMNDATPFLLERGRALPKDFPPHFTSRCIHLSDLLTAINAELSAFLLRQQYRRQLEETRREARGQYARMSELLSTTAAHLEQPPQPVWSETRRRTYSVGAALRPKEGEAVSGDSLTAFETDSGSLYLLLSDGMGTGEAARRESAMVLRLLERFLRAGVEPEAALRTLNDAMTLRGAETGTFTTIDLVRLDLQSAQVTVYKYGAAPSYLKHGGRVRRITGSSLPAGLHTTDRSPDATTLVLEEDSFLVMISDGVADAAHDEWLQDLLAGWQGDDPQTLVTLILTSIRQKGPLRDDCGVQVLYLPKSETGTRREV